MRVLITLALAILVSGCGSMSPTRAQGRVMIVDGRGAPIQGATLMPDYEYPPATAWKYTKDELAVRTSDAQGMILADLNEYFWDSDKCYHFRVHLAGFEDATMAVSKEMFPAVLKIEVKDPVQPSS
jgi:hypothetical protein